MSPLPSLFISHGAPTFVLQPGLAGPQLRALGARLPRPRAVLALSPHWMRPGADVTGAERPATIHDFGGFERRLYEIEYPVAGDPALAQQVRQRLQAAGIRGQIDPGRGLDHGVWVPLLHLFPNADVPVVQLAMPPGGAPKDYYAMGQALAPLADDGVLMIGSGTLTHNLYDIAPGAAPPAYVLEFRDWVRNCLAQGDLAALLDYRRVAPGAARAHPSDEHLMPLYFALGAADDWRQNRVIDGGVDYGVLSMDSFAFGSGSAAAFAPEVADAAA